MVTREENIQVTGVLTSSQMIFSRKPLIPRRPSMISITCFLARSTRDGQSWLSTSGTVEPFEKVLIVSSFPEEGKRWPTGTRTTIASFPSGEAEGSLMGDES